MEPHEFVGLGLQGSRQEDLNEVLSFLDETRPGYLFVYGAFNIGKTSLVERALAERTGQHRMIRPDHPSAYMKLGLSTFTTLAKSRVEKAGLKPPRKSRMADTTYASLLMNQIEGTVRSERFVIFWLYVSDVDETHIELDQLLSTQTDDTKDLTRKFILELRRDQSLKLGAGSGIRRRTIQVEGFEDGEIEDILFQRLANRLVDPPRWKGILGRCVSRLIGSHQLLLEELIQYLRARKAAEFAPLNELRDPLHLERALNELIIRSIDEHPKAWNARIEQICEHFSSEARECLRSEIITQEIRRAGLVYEHSGQEHMVFLVSHLAKRRIFISYSRDDKELLYKLRRDLEEHGEEVRTDDDIQGGENVSERIAEEITRSHHFLVILTKSAMESSWVRGEIDIAVSHANNVKDYSIVPALMEDVTMPAWLSIRNWIDFRGKYDEGISKLRTTLEKSRKGRASNSPLPKST